MAKGKQEKIDGRFPANCFSVSICFSTPRALIQQGGDTQKIRAINEKKYPFKAYSQWSIERCMSRLPLRIGGVACVVGLTGLVSSPPHPSVHGDAYDSRLQVLEPTHYTDNTTF